MPWLEAGDPPHDNVIGLDPRLTDPEGGDFRPPPGSPAAAYGCQSFPGPRPRPEAPASPPVVDAWPRRSHQDAGGPLTADTVWSADTVRVHADVTVPDGVTLTIAPGTVVEVRGYFGLAIQGRILALGEADRPVRFDRAAAPRGAPGDTATAWRGVAFVHTPETNPPSLLRWCDLAHAYGSALTFTGFSRCRVENSVLRENTADRGGAVHCSHYAAPELVDCLLVGNEATVSGAALYCQDAQPRLTHCTLTGNVDANPDAMVRAAAVVAMIAKPQLTGCIVWDNPSHYFLDECLVQTKPYYVRYCDVEFGHEGEGNLAADPLFVGAGAFPQALAADSPCVAAGRPDTTGLALPALDLAGRPRFVDDRLDLGCLEHQGAATLVDGTPAPTRRLLAPAYPNPANPGTTLVFHLARPATVRLEILDPAGRRVRTLLAGEHREAGRHAVRWRGDDDDGRAVASGVYLARLGAGDRRDHRRLVIIR